MQVGDPIHMVFRTSSGMRCVDFEWADPPGIYESVGEPEVREIYFGQGHWQFDAGAAGHYDGPSDPNDPTGVYGGTYHVHWGTCESPGSMDSESYHSDSGSGWGSGSSLQSSHPSSGVSKSVSVSGSVPESVPSSGSGISSGPSVSSGGSSSGPGLPPFDSSLGSDSSSGSWSSSV